MTKKGGATHRARLTLEFRLEAVRLVKAGQDASVTARVLGMLSVISQFDGPAIKLCDGR